MTSTKTKHFSNDKPEEIKYYFHLTFPPPVLDITQTTFTRRQVLTGTLLRLISLLTSTPSQKPSPSEQLTVVVETGSPIDTATGHTPGRPIPRVRSRPRSPGLHLGQVHALSVSAEMDKTKKVSDIKPKATTVRTRRRLARESIRRGSSWPTGVPRTSPPPSKTSEPRSPVLGSKTPQVSFRILLP